MVNIDFAAPVITLGAPNPLSGKVRSRAFSATDDDPAATTWRSRIQTGACDSSPHAQAVTYTEGADVTANQQNHNGSYVCFWSTDAADNTAVARSVQISDIDRIAPTISVGATQTSFDEQQSVTITFTPSEPIKGFDFTDVKLSATGIVNVPRQVDFKALSDDSYTLRLTGASQGRVTVSVDANKFTDIAGNPNTAASSPNVTLTVNERVLARTGTPLITDPSGTSPLRGTQTVSGTAEPGATVTASLGSLSAPPTTATGGSWSVSFNTALLADGRHQLSVTALASDKTISLAAQRTITVDNTNPTVTITSQPAGGVARSKSVTATASDTSAISVFGYKFHTSSLCPTSAAGITAHTLGTELVLGASANNRYVCFYATDAAGNVGRAASQLVSNIDVVPPVVTITTQPAGGVARSKSVTATASDTSAISVFGYKFHTSSACPESAAGITAHTRGTALTLGASANNRYVCFYATDAAGNVGRAASQLVSNIDVVPPVVTITTQPAGGVARSKSVTATASDTSAISVFGYKFHTSSLCPTSAAGITAHTLGTELVLGASANNRYVCFYATDVAGNVGRAASQLVSNIDVVPPVVTITTQPAGGVARSKSVIATVADASSISVFGYLLHSSNACPPSPTGLTAYTSGSQVQLGESANNSYVCFYATDAAGNTGQAVSQLVAGIDTTPPMVTITEQPISGVAASKSVAATATDVNAIASFGYLLHSSSFCPPNPFGLTAYTSAAQVTLNESANNRYVCFYATDEVGNTGQAASQLVADIDSSVPRVTITRQPAPGAARSKSVIATVADASSISVFGYLLHSSNACPPSPTGLTAYTSGSQVQLGESANNSYVCFYATDAAGNTGQAVSQLVAGIDATPPTVTITAQPASGVAQSKSVTATASDNVGVASFGYLLHTSSTCPASSAGSTAHISGSPVTLSAESANSRYVCFYARDAAGNVGQAVSQQVSGIDTTAPQVSITAQPASGLAQSKSVTATASDANAISSFGYELSSSSFCLSTPSSLTAHHQRHTAGAKRRERQRLLRVLLRHRRGGQHRPGRLSAGLWHRHHRAPAHAIHRPHRPDRQPHHHAAHHRQRKHHWL